MYISYTLGKNEKLKYARYATKSQHKVTYFLTYALLNISAILLVVSFFLYFLHTPLVIDHVTIPQRDEFGVFLISLSLTFLLILLAWHFKRQFSFLYQLALRQTNYAHVEIWADASHIRFRLDQQDYDYPWKDIEIKHNNYQTYLNVHTDKSQLPHLLVIPNTHVASHNMINNFMSWKNA